MRPPPSLVRQGRHAAIQQQRLRPGCALWRRDAAIVWRASGAWWGVRPDSWYCCETGMLLVVLGWQKHLGAAGRGMGRVPRLLCGVAPLAGLPRLRGSPALVGTEAGRPRCHWLVAPATEARGRAVTGRCERGPIGLSLRAVEESVRCLDRALPPTAAGGTRTPRGR